MKCFVTTVSEGKKFSPHEIQMQWSCLGDEVLEVEGAVVHHTQTLHLQELLEGMGEASLDLAVALEQEVEKQLEDEAS
jgi:hypothetical protein